MYRHFATTTMIFDCNDMKYESMKIILLKSRMFTTTCFLRFELLKLKTIRQIAKIEYSCDVD